jgi:hypothetical protein
MLASLEQKKFRVAGAGPMCSCQGYEGKKRNCPVTIYATSGNGLEKSYSIDTQVECAPNAQAQGTIILPISNGDEGGISGIPIGDAVLFAKTDYGTEQDCITPNVCLTRPSDGGAIYNAVTDTGYTGLVKDTEWSFAGNCYQGQVLKPWRGAMMDVGYWGYPAEMIGEPGCLHLITDNQYYNITLDSWTSSGNGGGFSYTRQQVTPFTNWKNFSGFTYFSKADYATGTDAEDCLNEGVCITRAGNSGLYNSKSESSSSKWGGSPLGTQWTFTGYCKAIDAFSLTTWYSAVRSLPERSPPEQVGKKGCLYLPDTEEYYDIIFTNWTNGGCCTNTYDEEGNGGGFAYYRRASTGPDFVSGDEPSNFVATPVSFTEIDLSWTDNSDNELGFRVEQSPDNWSNWVTIGTVAPNVTTYSNTDLNIGTTYYYRIMAYTADANSSSASAFATTLDFIPVNFSATATSITDINLSWGDSPNTNTELGFKILRFDPLNSVYVEIASVGPSVTTYLDSDLNVGVIYSYKIFAYNADLSSGPAYSSVATLDFNPLNFSGSVGPLGEVELNWSDNSNTNSELGFRIFKFIGNLWVEIGSVGANTFEYVDTNVAPLTTYSYQVMAFTADYNSGVASTSITTPKAYTLLFNCTDLSNMRNNLDGYYRLNNDIDCSDTINWNSGAGFEPIGTISNRFTGILDGNNHTISGLYINRPTNTDYVGLIGVTLNSQGAPGYLKNLHLLNSTVIGGNYVGGLVGSAVNNFYIQNSSFEGTVSGSSTAQYIGGLAGYLYNYSSITHSYFKGAVTSNWGGRIGGLVGYNTANSSITTSYAEINLSNAFGGGTCGGIAGDNSSSSISNSYALGTISCGSGSVAAGIVGLNESSTVTNTYFSGNISGWTKIGGVVGGATNLNTINNSFATARITATFFPGGVYGYAPQSNITNCYWFDQVGDSATNCYDGGNTGCTKKTAADGGLAWFYNITNAPMSSWDFTTIWSPANDDVNYPTLR